jgi:hypothetical protein
MNINEINEALNQALQMQRNADDATRRMANTFLPHRLRSLGLYGSTLRALKRELRSFNSTTCRWEDK